MITGVIIVYNIEEVKEFKDTIRRFLEQHTDANNFFYQAVNDLIESHTTNSSINMFTNFNNLTTAPGAAILKSNSLSLANSSSKLFYEQLIQLLIQRIRYSKRH
eukprot:TRINITY_DN4703_c0_g1_i1.p1 TRINITY_DN4703_c0_g1~~TRINITY_DN4703_c0_g1_i1.p1  ORF type:complete len:104 (-),score=14.40 TRINITY_DN4703_c0_g1_i1:454-765(-)